MLVHSYIDIIPSGIPHVSPSFELTIYIWCKFLIDNKDCKIIRVKEILIPYSV